MEVDSLRGDVVGGMEPWYLVGAPLWDCQRMQPHVIVMPGSICIPERMRVPIRESRVWFKFCGGSTTQEQWGKPQTTLDAVSRDVWWARRLITRAAT